MVVVSDYIGWLGSLPRADALSGVPTFTPAAGSPGLDLLAEVAASAGTQDHTPNTGEAPRTLAAMQQLHTPGPFNPLAVLPGKVVKKILNLEFVEMAEISLDEEPELVPGCPPPPKRPPVTNISQWLEKFSLMAATLVTRFPNKAAEFFIYQASIIRAERHFEPGRWVTYDRQFRREALARKDLDWSQKMSHLYIETFTGRARNLPLCSTCGADDHPGSRCPRSMGWIPAPSVWSPTGLQAGDSHTPRDICNKFNEGRCRIPWCRYTHACKGCGAGHPLIMCPRSQPGPNKRRRSGSPLRGQPGSQLLQP